MKKSSIRPKKPVGVGVDILELKRLDRIRDLPRVAELVFSPAEQSELAAHVDPARYFASRFSLKEAVIKACPDELYFNDFEIAKRGKKPVVRFFGKKRPYEISVSLSHSNEYVAGFAVAVYHAAHRYA